MRSISTAVSTKTTEGVKYVWFVANGTTAGSRMATTNTVAGQNINYTNNYDAGTPNYATLGIDPSKFKDPQNTEYRLGGTTLQGGAFQVAAKLEAGGRNVSTVSGNYTSRNLGAITATGATSAFTIAATHIGKFKRGDTVTVSG
jgi:hypothetical protein